MAISALVIAAIVAHFWQLDVPNMLIYDEHIYVDEPINICAAKLFSRFIRRSRS